MDPISFVLGLGIGAGIDELARYLNPKVKGWLERRRTSKGKKAPKGKKKQAAAATA